jgi:hypothetical protein
MMRLQEFQSESEDSLGIVALVGDGRTKDVFQTRSGSSWVAAETIELSLVSHTPVKQKSTCPDRIRWAKSW